MLNPILSSIIKCARKRQIFNRMNIELFDVSLRDGIQGQPAELFPLERKKQIFKNILMTHCPPKMEIGALTKLPSMTGSLEMYNYVKNYTDMTEPYILIPNFRKFSEALKHGIEHMSFIASVSDRFQLANTGKTMDDTRLELNVILKHLSLYAPHTQTKLYISCVNRCPFVGYIHCDLAVYRIMEYIFENKYDEVCLSDTCGTLTHPIFVKIVDKLIHMGVSPKNISLHLHVSPTNINEVDEILMYSFRVGIRMFDVSALDTGGCSVLNKEDMKSNLSYTTFYTVLNKYIESEMGRDQ